MLLLTLIIRSFHRSNYLWPSFLCRYLLRNLPQILCREGPLCFSLGLRPIA